MPRIIVVSLILLASLLSACNSTPASTSALEAAGQQVVVPGGSYTDVSVAELQTMLAN